MLAAHDLDEGLSASVLLENLACKTTGALALERLLALDLAAEDVDYAIGCGEEAVGDQYQRGGGNLGKAIAEQADCTDASGCDVKAFCAGPRSRTRHGCGARPAGVYEHVAVVAGGSLAKLGMKFAGALKNGVPVLEDLLAGLAIRRAALRRSPDPPARRRRPPPDPLRLGAPGGSPRISSWSRSSGSAAAS